MARRSRMVRPTPRRKRVWADTQIIDLGFAEDSLRSNDLLADFVTSGGAHMGCTVVRTVIDLMWGINEAHTPSDYLTIGLIKGTTATADVADPRLEPYADWAWIQTAFSGVTTGLVTADASEFIHVDTPASRKIDEIGETWWLIFKGTAPVTATATYDVRCRVRTLLLLP